MNEYFDKSMNLLWHLCQAEENEDRNPPDYTFSFARSNRTKLGGILSKDVAQSYVVRSEKPAEYHRFSLRNISEETPGYSSDELVDRDDQLEILAWAGSSDETEEAGLTFGGTVVKLTPQELERLRAQENGK